MKHITYKTHGTCSVQIDLDLDDEKKVHNFVFTRGCNGNTQGVSKLVEGMDAQAVIDRLSGINCNGRGTSCPDQLTKAIREGLLHE